REPPEEPQPEEGDVVEHVHESRVGGRAMHGWQVPRGHSDRPDGERGRRREDRRSQSGSQTPAPGRGDPQPEQGCRDVAEEEMLAQVGDERAFAPAVVERPEECEGDRRERGQQRDPARYGTTSGPLSMYDARKARNASKTRSFIVGQPSRWSHAVAATA